MRGKSLSTSFHFVLLWAFCITGGFYSFGLKVKLRTGSLLYSTIRQTWGTKRLVLGQMAPIAGHTIPHIDRNCLILYSMYQDSPPDQRHSWPAETIHRHANAGRHAEADKYSKYWLVSWSMEPFRKWTLWILIRLLSRWCVAKCIVEQNLWDYLMIKWCWTTNQPKQSVSHRDWS